MGLFRKKETKAKVEELKKDMAKIWNDGKNEEKKKEDSEALAEDGYVRQETRTDEEIEAAEKRGDTSPSGTDGVADAVEKLLARFPASKFVGSEIEGLMEGIKDIISTKDPKKIQKASDVPSSTPNLDSTSQLHRIIELLEKIEKNTSKYGNLQEILEKIERLENIDRAYHRYD